MAGNGVRGVVLGALVLGAMAGEGRLATSAEAVGTRKLLDNERMIVVEYTFPVGFRGEEHAAITDELAYVLAGELSVTTRGRGRRVVGRGEVEYASRGTVHESANDGAVPAVVLVVMLKGRSS